MQKTVTLRLDNVIYAMFRKAAEGERRTIANFIEYATLAFLINELYVTDSEMDDILGDKNLITRLKKGLKDVKKGKYRIAA